MVFSPIPLALLEAYHHYCFPPYGISKDSMAKILFMFKLRKRIFQPIVQKLYMFGRMGSQEEATVHYLSYLEP